MSDRGRLRWPSYPAGSIPAVRAREASSIMDSAEVTLSTRKVVPGGPIWISKIVCVVYPGPCGIDHNLPLCRGVPPPGAPPKSRVLSIASAVDCNRLDRPEIVTQRLSMP